MFKKTIKTALCILLSVTTCLLTCTNAFAAGGKSKTYVSETVLSYGSTDDEAKKWLTDNGYEILDHNLNEGADDTFSTKRAVYLGYKTTENAEEAITDMRVMNMKGGYSVQDYQLLLEEKKTQISVFIDSFIVAVNEYRTNYNNGSQRAKAAHDMLNMLVDDDTSMKMGDLLLNKIKEEYTDEDYAALSDEVKSKTADMTTILMQANSSAVLTIEQTIAIATDSGDDLWIDRFSEAKTYDDMLDELMEEKNLTVNQAEKELSIEYDADAKSIASKLADYISYLESSYLNEGITLTSSEEDIEAYRKANKDFDISVWFTAGTQYELLDMLENDGITLLELFTSEDFDPSGDDRYLLYPLVASLTKGQRACLDFISMYQLVALGLNDDESLEKAMNSISSDDLKKAETSVYAGINREIFGSEVALTGEAYRLQCATGNDAMSIWTDGLSDMSRILIIAAGVSLFATAASWAARPLLSFIIAKMEASRESLAVTAEVCRDNLSTRISAVPDSYDVEELAFTGKARNMATAIGRAKVWQDVFFYAGIAFSCVFVVLAGLSLWSTYSDLKEYYNAEFTPIPAYMVDEGTNDNDEKVYTYYSAVKCNRIDAGLVTESTALLKDFGDLNGDVGRQWVALYTTKDKAAGNPLTTNFKVQYESSAIPDDRAPLSIFCEDTAQNLTDKRAGYTYADGKNGIYMFFASDANAYAGSVFTHGKYALFGGVTVILAAAAFFLGTKMGKKRDDENTKSEATA